MVKAATSRGLRGPVRYRVLSKAGRPGRLGVGRRYGLGLVGRVGVVEGF